MLGKKQKPIAEPAVKPCVAESLLSQIVVIEQELHHITLTSAAKKRAQAACAAMRTLIQPEEIKS